MDKELRDGKLYLFRTDQERAPLLQRLAKIEGQLRGVQQMIQGDRYCGEELQQIQAILSATREVMRLIVSQHVRAGIEHAMTGQAPQVEIMADIEAVLRSLTRDQ